MKRVALNKLPFSLSQGPVKAVIWDLDGVLVDSGPYHFRAWQALAQKQGIAFSEADFRATFGQRNPEIIQAVFGPGATLAEIDRLSQRKEALFRELVAGHIQPLPGAVPLVLSLAEAGCPQALVSSTPRQNIDLILEALDLGQLFRTIVAGEDVDQGKPNPEGFLLAAHRLGVRPQRVLVVEDSVAGVRAARAAGMHCLAVAITHPRERLAEANLVVDTLEEVTAPSLLSALSAILD